MKIWRNLSKTQKVIELLCLAVLAGMLLFLVIGWGSIPDQIPGHYNGAGEVDRWTGKGELLLMPFFTVLMYGLLTVCNAVCIPSVRKMELPQLAMAWLGLVKLVVLAGLACLALSMARAKPMPEAFTPVFIGAAAVPCVGFLVSSLRFAIRQGRK